MLLCWNPLGSINVGTFCSNLRFWSSKSLTVSVGSLELKAFHIMVFWNLLFPSTWDRLTYKTMLHQQVFRSSLNWAMTLPSSAWISLDTSFKCSVGEASLKWAIHYLQGLNYSQATLLEKDVNYIASIRFVSDQDIMSNLISVIYIYICVWICV